MLSPFSPQQGDQIALHCAHPFGMSRLRPRLRWLKVAVENLAQMLRIPSILTSISSSGRALREHKGRSGCPAPIFSSNKTLKSMRPSQAGATILEREVQFDFLLLTP